MPHFINCFVSKKSVYSIWLKTHRVKCNELLWVTGPMRGGTGENPTRAWGLRWPGNGSSASQQINLRRNYEKSRMILLQFKYDDTVESTSRKLKDLFLKKNILIFDPGKNPFFLLGGCLAHPTPTENSSRTSVVSGIGGSILAFKVFEF